MPRSLASKLLAGAWAVLMSRQLAGQSGRPEEAENGDVIKVNRGVYDHYGVYVSAPHSGSLPSGDVPPSGPHSGFPSDPHVIHYTGATGPADFNSRVRETSLEEFLNGARGFAVCRFPKSLDSLDSLIPKTPTGMGRQPAASPLRKAWEEIKRSKARDYHLYSGAETVARARAELGKEGYNIVCNNCEHFAVWCKTGLKESSQVNRAIEILLALCG